MTADSVRYGSRYGSDGSDATRRSCPVCGRPSQSSRATYCSQAHRQLAFRRRHAAPAPAPVKLPLHFIVYQCPDCEQRFLGERRCPDCNRFCRRLGAGDACPHCGDPVAVSDLLP